MNDYLTKCKCNSYFITSSDNYFCVLIINYYENTYNERCQDIHTTSRRAARICRGGGQKLIDTRGVAKILVRGGKKSDKIFSKVARISFRSGDI